MAGWLDAPTVYSHFQQSTDEGGGVLIIQFQDEDKDTDSRFYFVWKQMEFTNGEH